MRFAFLFLIACSAKAPSTEGDLKPIAPALVKPPEPVAPVRKPYSGPADRGPCNDAHECKLRSNCGCSCEGVVLTAPSTTDCDKSCDNPDVCKGHTLICDLGSQTCGALPKAP